MLSCIDPNKKGYEPIYRGSAKRGNPEKIKFHIKRTPLGLARELELHRGSSEKRLCAKLMSLYPTLDEERLKAFVADVPEDLWNDFKTYAYNGVPKAVEQPHSWNGTMESFVFYIMEQWIKQHSANPEPQQQTFAFAEAEEVKPGEKEWQMYLRLIDKDLASDLGKVRYMLYKKGCVLLGIQNDAQREMIEDHFIDDAVLKHAQECAMKIFGNKISLAYKNIKQ